MKRFVLVIIEEKKVLYKLRRCKSRPKVYFKKELLELKVMISEDSYFCLTVCET